jgi:hypothetical protein
VRISNRKLPCMCTDPVSQDRMVGTATSASLTPTTTCTDHCRCWSGPDAGARKKGPECYHQHVPNICRSKTDIMTDKFTAPGVLVPTERPRRQCRCRQVPTGTHWYRHVPTGAVGAGGCAARYPPCRAALAVPNLQFRDFPKLLDIRSS